jgi:hypothetical protein
MDPLARFGLLFSHGTCTNPQYTSRDMRYRRASPMAGHGKGKGEANKNGGRVMLFPGTSAGGGG